MKKDSSLFFLFFRGSFHFFVFFPRSSAFPFFPPWFFFLSLFPFLFITFPIFSVFFSPLSLSFIYPSLYCPYLNSVPALCGLCTERERKWRGGINGRWERRKRGGVVGPNEGEGWEFLKYFFTFFFQLFPFLSYPPFFLSPPPPPRLPGLSIPPYTLPIQTSQSRNHLVPFPMSPEAPTLNTPPTAVSGL